MDVVVVDVVGVVWMVTNNHNIVHCNIAKCCHLDNVVVAAAVVVDDMDFRAKKTEAAEEVRIHRMTYR